MFRSVYEKIRRHGSSIAFITGFIWDSLTLGRIDQAFAHITLSVYLTLSAISIIVIHMHESRRERLNVSHKYAAWLPYILQFCFGGLFSAYIIFYTSSASLAVSWPFLAFLILLVVVNELLHRHYTSTIFQVGMFFAVLMSYSIFSLPILLAQISDEVFIVSGFLSIAVITLLAFLLKLLAPEIYTRNHRGMVFTVLTIYILFHVAYFTNIIPPVPLSLRQIGVYHNLVRAEDGTYRVSFEPSQWYPWLKNTSATFTKVPGEPVYVFTSVFAPTKLSAPLFYAWSYFDVKDKKWITLDRIAFPIVGGRAEGYRGYTIKNEIFSGKWRVDLETFRKQRVGRVEFEVVESAAPPKLVNAVY